MPALEVTEWCSFQMINWWMEQFVDIYNQIHVSRIITFIEGLYKSSMYFYCFQPHIIQIFPKSKPFLLA